MAKTKDTPETATTPEAAAVMNEVRSLGNDPVRIHDEVQAYRQEIYSRIYGTHRWRIAIPNFASYRYFECECGPDEEAQARGVYAKTVGTSIPSGLADKYEFVYVGKTADLGPAPSNDRIPFNKRKVTWPQHPNNIKVR